MTSRTPSNTSTGGTAGCIVAARLAAADPNLSVLLIEAGANNYKVDTITHPILYARNLTPESKATIFHVAKQSHELAGRSPVVACGGTLGGGSSNNMLMYSRAQRCDFDAWKVPGWSADELIPYLKKLETYHSPNPDLVSASPSQAIDAIHGKTGPVHISAGNFTSTAAVKEYLRAGAEIGYPSFSDLQDLGDGSLLLKKKNDGNKEGDVGGLSPWLRNVSPIDGSRQDTAHCYLHPLLNDGQHPNLHVLVEHLVDKVLLEENDDLDSGDRPADSPREKRAVGVQIIPNPLFSTSSQPQSQSTTTEEQQQQVPEPNTITILARKQVVLSAGACASPAILERSGIGSPAILSDAGVPVQVPLPGVGANYQDHNMVLIPYSTSLSASETADAVWTMSADEILSPRKDHEHEHEHEQDTSKHPMASWNAVDVAGKLRPFPSQVLLSEEADSDSGLGLGYFTSSFKQAYARDFAPHPEKPLLLSATLMLYIASPSPPPPPPSGQKSKTYITLANYTAYPYSRGSIHIVSPSPLTPPCLDLGFFTDQTKKGQHGKGDQEEEEEKSWDLQALVWGYMQTRHLVRRCSFYRGEVARDHPRFPEGSEAACVDLDIDLDADADAPPSSLQAKQKDIRYTQEDCQAIEQWVRERASTTWHSMGTCKMGTSANRAHGDDAVVDPQLSVYGVARLKVVDLSVVPGNVGANTCNTAMLIGEKGAEILGRELGVVVKGRES